MLSDEEKKAIKELTEIKELFEEDLKENYEVTATLDQIDLESLVIALNLIEKQSKEIEELKEENKKLTDEYLVQRDLINPDFLKDYIHKNKIKAKIEAIKTNKLQYFHIAPENWAINILQSLLEKE